MHNLAVAVIKNPE